MPVPTTWFFLVVLATSTTFAQQQCGIRGPSWRAAVQNDSGTEAATRAGVSAKSQGILRIVGGVEAQPLEFPWQISLRNRAPFTNEDQGHSCGGSIISERYIMTAAHCVEGFSLSSLTITRHPYWDSNTMNYDYAILRLATPLDFRGRHRHLMPICLPRRNEDFEGQTCTASGWGLTRDRSEGGNSLPPKLQKTDLPVVDHNVCRLYYSHIMEVHDNTMVCAGPMHGGKGVCQGDSGGPLQCRRSDGRYVLAGATSWGVKCAGENQPGVFARISTQVDWIKYVAGITT
ncbi:transmembrane protease serine 9-like [Ixodes scapularis]|uniref:transmembrane protease serine 9-like n=1 Tax=Ixodes scapularis TaxID=6945 RepID=UPI001C393842|nr:transmembrane protease serine 9-like [Ixodes scapularis]